MVVDPGEELANLDAGLADRTVTNARRGCPPLRERLPLVERCGCDHRAHLASIADRRVGLRPLLVAYGDAAGPDFDARFFGTRKKARSIVARPVLRSTAPMEVVMRTSLRRSREAKRHRSRKHAFEIDFRCRTTDKGSQVRRAHLRWHKQPSLKIGRASSRERGCQYV